jgi:hypothetical protein
MARLRCVAVGLVFGLASATGTVVRRFLTTRTPPRKGDAKEQRQPRDESRVQSACAPKEPTHAKLTRERPCNKMKDMIVEVSRVHPMVTRAPIHMASRNEGSDTRITPDGATWKDRETRQSKQMLGLEQEKGSLEHRVIRSRPCSCRHPCGSPCHASSSSHLLHFAHQRNCSIRCAVLDGSCCDCCCYQYSDCACCCALACSSAPGTRASNGLASYNDCKFRRPKVAAVR